MAAAKGRMLGEFVLGDVVEQNPGRSVYRARQPILERDAIVKVHEADTAERAERFVREARLASRIDHPYAAHVYAFGVESDGTLWIAMELVRGTPLATLLEQGPLPSGVAFVQRVCSVVQAVHELGIVHGDLKPSNIMVLARGGSLFPKLLDFGIARELGDNIGEGSGTMQYMAPEQWVAGKPLTAATDVYALGALAYETLTGRPPFVATSRLGYAKAHARSPPPALPDGFPAWLSNALERAMAKEPGDRFAHAGELARAVAGPPETLASVSLPRLDEMTRDDALLGAPEPVAEAVSQLDAVRDADAMYAALWRLLGTLAQVVATYALGARQRVRAVDSEAAAALLAELRDHGLSPRGWWRLARELVRPFAAIREAFPLPELVDTFFDREAEITTALDVAFADADGPLVAPTHEVVIAELARLVPAVALGLRRLRWLATYRLVGRSKRGAQLWMGVARRERAIVDVIVNGPALLSGSDAVVVELGEVVVIAEPSAGAPRELFVVDGPGRAGGARFRAIPGELEHEVQNTWARLGVERKSLMDDPLVDVASPYLGLATFTEAHASVFFGRDRELEELRNRLRTTGFLAIVGPSGSGKSSFIRAGLVPSLGESWRTVTLRPGNSPLRSLAAATDLSTAELRTNPEVLAERFGEARVLVFVDQFEELFTLSTDESDRIAFAAALVALGARETARVIVTLRDDFLVRAAQLPPLAKISAAIQLLTTPHPEELVRILVEPARRSGYGFEDEAFAEQIVSEVADQPGALALLSFTASKLWQLRDRQAKQLTRTAYRALGGVGGALARHAEAVLAAMTDAERGVVRELFRHLVTAAGTRTVLTRDETYQVGGGAIAIPVVEALIRERLLTAMEVPGGESIEVVHETLLVSWPRLVEWRARDVETARQRDQLRAAARQWDERKRPRGMLWRSDALTEYRLWRNRFPGQLTAVEEAFAAASIADANRGRRIRRGIAGTIFVALAVALVIFVRLRGEAEASRRRAQGQLVESYLDEAMRAAIAGDAFASLVYLDGASRLGTRSFELRFLVARALEQLAPELVAMDVGGPAGRVRFARDAIVSLGADGRLRRWSATGHEVWGSAAYAPGADPLLAIDSTATTIATAGEGHLDLWSLDGKRTRRLALEGQIGRVGDLQFTPDDKRLVATGFDGTVRVWELASDRATTIDMGDPVPVVMGLAGERIVVGSRNQFVVWSPATGASEPLAITDAALDTATLQRVALAANGKRVAVGTNSGTIELWNVVDRELERVLVGHEGMIWTLRFEGDHLLSGSADATVRVWRHADGALVQTLRGHRGSIFKLLVDPAGRVITTSMDGTLKIWDRTSGTALETFAHGGTIDFAIASDGKRIATASNVGTIELWRTDVPVGVRRFATTPGYMGQAPWISADGTRLARTSETDTELWDTTTPRLLGRFGGNESFPMGGGDRLWIAEGTKLIVARATDGVVLRELAAPFAIVAMCAAPSGASVLVASESELALVDETGAVRARRTLANIGNLGCGIEHALAIGDRATLLAMPTLATVRDEAAPTSPEAVVLASGEFVTTPTRNEIAIWRGPAPTRRIRFTAAVQSLATHGDRFAVGLVDGRLVEYDIRTWQPRRELRAHQAPVMHVALSDSTLATSGVDGVLRVWGNESPRTLLEVRPRPGQHWIRIAGEQLYFFGANGVENRSLAASSITRDELSQVVACRIPKSVRDQIGGPRSRVACR